MHCSTYHGGIVLPTHARPVRRGNIPFNPHLINHALSPPPHTRRVWHGVLTAPQMIHPLEAFGYYVLLYSPPFLFGMPVASFAVYMAVCGTCGVLDHAGIALSVPGLYDTSGTRSIVQKVCA